MQRLTTLAAYMVVLLLLPLLILLWATESQHQRIRRQRRQGWTLQRIATHHGISVSTVRRRLR